MSENTSIVILHPTPGPWRLGRDGSVVADSKDGSTMERVSPKDEPREVAYYGGYLICGNVRSCNALVIVAGETFMREFIDWYVQAAVEFYDHQGLFAFYLDACVALTVTPRFGWDDEQNTRMAVPVRDGGAA
jgi:hypothetical protein